MVSTFNYVAPYDKPSENQSKHQGRVEVGSVGMSQSLLLFAEAVGNFLACR